MKDKYKKVNLEAFKKDTKIKIEHRNDIPILLQHDSRKPFGKITQEHAKELNSFLVNGQKCILDPAYMIKKFRKPTLKERMQHPGIKRIIEDCELLEVSICPVLEEAPKLNKEWFEKETFRENIFILFCHHLVTVISRIKQKVKNLI